eukprot:TRINITY_DN14320_c0_g1_i1.p1 TRINITY_DN14320_c0_g1~~TRINITY_DN14320_c0_g1_i1.p1  ORF type:complete len:297 (-),score=38.88 TRINITY_DN14320_c0_g1_i1:392-1201(-)
MSMFRGVMERILKPLKDRSDFEPRIRGGTAPETQYLLAAATMPGWEGDAEDNVRMVIQSKWPDATWIKSRDLHRPLEGLHHRFVKVDHDSRDDVFLKAVEEAVNYPNHRLLVFGVHRQIVHRAHEILKQTGYEAAIFHSQVPFTIRCKTLADFATGKIRIIVCSPMASRGIDFPDVTRVISYEFGENAPELLHRLGRTARRGRRGGPPPSTRRTRSPSSRASGNLCWRVGHLRRPSVATTSSTSRRTSPSKNSWSASRTVDRTLLTGRA